MIKISYVPKAGDPSNYSDCQAVAPDGSVWRSIDNRWQRVFYPDIDRSELRRLSIDDADATMALLRGVLGFFLGMAFFAKPVGMSFESIAVGVPVLMVICFVSAAAFYMVGR